MAEDEHADFASAFTSTFGKDRKFGDPGGTQERLKAERRAGLTPKQRGKKSKAKKQLNTRATDETHNLIEKLTAKLDCAITDIIEIAVKRLAEAEGIK
jgi:hypothetical protein